jgi:hypothetical protein
MAPTGSDSSDTESDESSESSDSESDEIYETVDRRTFAKGYAPKDCGAEGSCFYQSAATFASHARTGKYDLRDAKKEGKTGPLRNKVVDKISRNKDWTPFLERPLTEMRRTDTFVDGEPEIIATCQVLDINLDIIGIDAAHDKTGQYGPSKNGKPQAGKGKAVLLHYDAPGENAHYVLGVPLRS